MSFKSYTTVQYEPRGAKRTTILGLFWNILKNDLVWQLPKMNREGHFWKLVPFGVNNTLGTRSALPCRAVV